MKLITPLKAIKEKCLDCTAGNSTELRACGIYKCPLWKFRLGRSPSSKSSQKNPLLAVQNFIGFENMEASKLLARIRNNQAKKHV